MRGDSRDLQAGQDKLQAGQTEIRDMLTAFLQRTS